MGWAAATAKSMPAVRRRGAGRSCVSDRAGVALYSRLGKPKDLLLEDEGDEQVDAVANNLLVLHIH